MKDLLIFILLILNFIALVYLYLKVRSLFEGKIDQSLDRLEVRLEERLKDLQEIKRDLVKLYAAEELGRAISEEVKKISGVLFGRRPGQTGERAVEEILSIFPPGIIARNVKLASGLVEFALRLRGERFVPIDSKLSSPEILAKSDLTPDDEREIVRRAKDRAKEITSYLKDERSAGFALMVIPDGLYGYLKLRIFSDLEREGIIPVPYQALPQTLMMVLTLWERFFFSLDRERLKEALPVLEKSLSSIERDLEQTKTELKSASNLLERVKGTLVFMQRYLYNLKDLD